MALDSKSLLFNAVTHHHAVEGYADDHLLFSDRQAVADRLYPLMLAEIDRQYRIRARRRKKFDRRQKNSS